MPKPSTQEPSDADASAKRLAKAFGSLIREKRQALNMRQDDLALASGLGRRFILELEAGKPTAQLGKALLAATTLGLRPFEVMSEDSSGALLLPELPDDEP